MFNKVTEKQAMIMIIIVLIIGIIAMAIATSTPQTIYTYQEQGVVTYTDDTGFITVYSEKEDATFALHNVHCVQVGDEIIVFFNEETDEVIEVRIVG